jgi:hypothetical protein
MLGVSMGVDRGSILSAVIARFIRAIQYAGTVVADRDAAAYWIPRLRGA